MSDNRGRQVRPTWSRAHIVANLRRAGYFDAAEAASHTLPEEVDEAGLLKLSREHGISRENLTDSMGGSP